MLKTQPGKHFGLPFTSIIDSSGVWLYDVKSLQDENTEYDSRCKEQSVEGYRSLLYYTNSINGVSILDKPMITKMYKTTDSFPADMPAVSVTGHVFNSTEEMFIFSNALCADWAINVNTLHMSAGVENNVDKMASFVVDQYAVLIAKTLNQLLDNGFTRFSDSDI
jgi:hypothetical protein